MEHTEKMLTMEANLKTIEQQQADFWKGMEELRKKQEELRESQQKTDEQMKRTDRKIESLTGNWGELVESLSEVGLEQELEKYGITGLNEVIPNMRVKNERGAIVKEYDRIFINTDVLVVVEVKTMLRHPDVDKHIKDFKHILQSRLSRGIAKVYGVLVFLSAHEDASKYAERKGLFTIKISGDGMLKTMNTTGFVPMNFVPAA